MIRKRAGMSPMLRNDEGECTAFAVFAVQLDCSTQQYRELLAQMQAKAGAAGRLGITEIHARKCGEQLGLIRGLDADSGIANSDLDDILPLNAALVQAEADAS